MNSSRNFTKAAKAGKFRRPWRSWACYARCYKDAEIGKLIVPIVPDEARTFGMESLFRTVGIYSSVGQKYEPVDVNTLLYYRGSERRADPRGRNYRGWLHGVIHCRRVRLCHAWHQHDSIFHLLLDVWLPAYRGFHLGCGPTCERADSYSAAPRGEPRCPAKACSTRTVTAMFWRCRYRTSRLTIRRLLMKSQ